MVAVGSAILRCLRWLWHLELVFIQYRIDQCHTRSLRRAEPEKRYVCQKWCRRNPGHMSNRLQWFFKNRFLSTESFREGDCGPTAVVIFWRMTRCRKHSKTGRKKVFAVKMDQSSKSWIIEFMNEFSAQPNCVTLRFWPSHSWNHK